MSSGSTLLRWLRRPSKAMVHVRCNFDNLGDIMVARAIDDMFSEVALVSCFPTRKVQQFDSLVGIERVLRFVCLGGGTLIFTPHNVGWLSALQFFTNRATPLCTFGTGVVDPEFLQELYSASGRASPLTQAAIDEWVACLEMFPFVLVRGLESERILRQHGLKRVTVLGDPALFYARAAMGRKDSGRRVGINLSTYSHFWGNSQQSALAEMSKVIDWLRKSNWTITLFPSMSEDEALASQVIRTLGCDDVAISRAYRDPREFLEQVERLDLFVGVKLHTVVAACCVYTPAIMIGYQPKCYDFMKTMDLDRYFLRSDQLEAEKLMSLIDAMYAERDSVQRLQFESCQRFKQGMLSYRDRILASIGVGP